MYFSQGAVVLSYKSVFDVFRLLRLLHGMVILQSDTSRIYTDDTACWMDTGPSSDLLAVPIILVFLLNVILIVRILRVLRATQQFRVVAVLAGTASSDTLRSRAGNKGPYEGSQSRRRPQS